jgi:TolA-binding protein
MSDLRPLLEEDATSIEARILRQARAREPSAGAAGRAIVALGLAGAATTATTGAAAAPVTAVVVKWLGLGALSATLLIGGGRLATVVLDRPSAVASRARVEPSKQAPLAASQQVATAPSAEPAVKDVVAPSAPAETASPPAEPPVRPASRSPLPVQEIEPPTPAVLDAEIALLDAARDAVAAHDPNRALRLLDEHGVRFPKGQLSQEATYVRVKALLERGSRAEAELTSQRFLAAHPDSPHAKRIRALLAQ